MLNNIGINKLIEKIEDIQIEPNRTWGIYGTGNGSKVVYDLLCKLEINQAIKVFIDRDDRVNDNDKMFGVPIKKLSEAVDRLDGIIIAAIDNHAVIEERIYNTLTEEQTKKICIVDIFSYNTKKDRLEFVSYIENRIWKDEKEFVAFDEAGYLRKEEDTKIITWYLPQFHQMEINNKFHGQGFTEWTNTSKAIPLYTGHYQPHIPYDVGYYDLLNPDTLRRQIYLAKHYGIYGFCFHYYWFSGTRIMEKPLELLLKHKDLDMPFCLDWATENWTALWDGGNNEIMLEQSLKAGDDQRFMDDILPYFSDPRYIKIDGRPVLVIYRISMFDKERAKNLLHSFREIAKKNGFPDLYIMLTNSFDFDDDAAEWEADAIVEFPPHTVRHLMDGYEVQGYLNPYFNGRIFDPSSFIKNKKYMINHRSKEYYRSALVSWDASARKATSKGFIIEGLNPKTFKTWLKDIMAESKQIHSASNDIVFVNSWNEWAEGSHLEPDMKYGYAYLQTIKEVFESFWEKD